MSITAHVLADSVSPNGVRLSSLVLHYPRFILAEVNTHRMLSRNSASSRAIPVAKYIRNATLDPVEPVEWGRNQPGMQARELADVSDASAAKDVWDAARDSALAHAGRLADRKIHKQLVNRILEPFVHADTIATATDAGWAQFLKLRLHADAQPEIRVLAKAIKLALAESRPERKELGQWHLPYGATDEPGSPTRDALMRSVARCARVSYSRHDGSQSSQEADDKLAESLHNSGHWSPFEHQAEPFAMPTRGNFNGWRQLREVLSDS